MKYKKIMNNITAINQVMNSVDKETGESNLTDFEAIQQFVVWFNKIRIVQETYQAMIRGVRRKYKKDIENAENDQIKISLINDDIQEEIKKIDDSEIPAELEIDISKPILYKKLNGLKLPPSVIAGLIDSSLVVFED